MTANKQEMEINLSKVPTWQLEEEIAVRKSEKVVSLTREKRVPLIFQCQTCGGKEHAGKGKFFANLRYGTLVWHYPCADYPNREKIGAMKLIQGYLRNPGV